MNLLIDKIFLAPYYLALKARDRYYRKTGKVKNSPVPTISIGNVTAGGTGKTPFTEMVLRELLSMNEFKGRHLAVLSRGYKRDSKGFQQVTADSSASMCGDEPLQIKKNFPEVTVAVDKNRVQGCEYLSDPEKFRASRKSRGCWNSDFPAADHIILDDAFQYRSLRPSLSIVLMDSRRPVFSDHLLPVGNLRDLPERIWEADVIVVTKCREDITDDERKEFAEKLKISGFNTETCLGNTPSGKRVTLLFSTITYCSPVPVFNTGEIRFAYAKRIVLFTGIANDTPLVRHLSDSYRIARRFRFPDHHKFVWSDIQKIVSVLKKDPTYGVVTTEKDAQRILDYKGMPELVRSHLLMVPIKVGFTSSREQEVFREKLLETA